MIRCKLFKTVIAAFTTFVFFVTSLGITPNAFALPAGRQVRSVEVFLPYQVALDRGLRIAIPQELGKLENFSAGQGPAIFHIQDAHGHYEGQQKTRRLLGYLNKSYGINTVLVEGSAFRLDPEKINFFPKDIKKTLAVNEEFTRRAWVSGVELFLLDQLVERGTGNAERIVSRSPRNVFRSEGVSAFGIEEAESYCSNGRSFVNVLTEKQKTGQFLTDMNMQIERLASHLLNKDLRDFLRRVESFEKGQIPFDAWLTQLKEGAQKHLEMDLASPAYQLDWPMLVRIFKIQELSSKLDMQKFPKERREFLKALRRFMPEDGERGTPNDSSTVHRSPFAAIEWLLRNNSMSVQLPDPETGLLFEDMVKHLPENFNYDKFPNVRYFIGTLILQSELKADRLMQEVQKLSAVIAGKLIRTKDEKKLVALLADHRLLQKLFALELTPADYEVISGRRKAEVLRSLKPSELVSEMKKFGLKERRTKLVEFSHVSELDELYEKAMVFYEGVKDRDGKMEARIEERLKETGATKVAVITGGFHSQPMKDHFINKGYSYALISPKLSGADDTGHENYIEAVLASIFPKKDTRAQPPGFTSINPAGDGFNLMGLRRPINRALGDLVDGGVLSKAESRTVIQKLAGRTAGSHEARAMRPEAFTQGLEFRSEARLRAQERLDSLRRREQEFEEKRVFVKWLIIAGLAGLLSLAHKLSPTPEKELLPSAPQVKSARMGTASRSEARTKGELAFDSGNLKVLVADVPAPDVSGLGGVELVAESGMGKDAAALQQVIETEHPEVVMVRSDTKAFKEPGFLKMASDNGMRVIIRAGVAVDNVDLKAAEANGISVIATHGSAASVSNLTLYLLLVAMRRAYPEISLDAEKEFPGFEEDESSESILALEADVQAMLDVPPSQYLSAIAASAKKGRGEISPAVIEEVFAGRDLKTLVPYFLALAHHETLGFIGFGPIAELTIKKLDSFSVPIRVMAKTRHKFRESNGAVRPLQAKDNAKFWKNVTILSIHASPEKGEPAIVTLKDIQSAPQLKFIVNTARSSSIAPDALAEFLKDPTHLYLADVDLAKDGITLPEVEPFLKAPNTVFINHAGASTQSALKGVEENAIPVVRAVSDLLSGRANDYPLVIRNGVMPAPIRSEARVAGLLFWPKNGVANLDISKLRSSDEVQALLQKAGPEGISIRLPLRGLDGPGSSLDLPLFQKVLTFLNAKFLKQVTSTPTLASNFYVTVTFKKSQDPESNEYVAPDYFPGVMSVKGDVDFSKIPEKQRQAYEPAYIFGNIFKLKGIRAELEAMPVMAMAGGMESSSAFEVALFAAASSLANAHWSLADIVSEALRIENDPHIFKGPNGCQGHLASILGGAYRHVWLSGIRTQEGVFENPTGAMSVPFLTDAQIAKLEKRLALVQAGKLYVKGKAKVKRTAGLINEMWTDLLKDRDPIGFLLHSLKLELAEMYVLGMQSGDMKTVIRTVNDYTDIRDWLQKRWLTLAIEPENAEANTTTMFDDIEAYFRGNGNAGIADQISEAKTKKWNKEKLAVSAARYHKTFFESEKAMPEKDRVFEPYFAKYGKGLMTMSLYTQALEPVVTINGQQVNIDVYDFVQEARKRGIAVMPLGAGGPSANLIAIAENEGDVENFFQEVGLPVFNEAEAKKIVRGETGKEEDVLRGFMMFKVGREGIRYQGFEKLGLETPGMPTPHSFKEGTSTFSIGRLEARRFPDSQLTSGRSEFRAGSGSKFTEDIEKTSSRKSTADLTRDILKRGFSTVVSGGIGIPENLAGNKAKQRRSKGRSETRNLEWDIVKDHEAMSQTAVDEITEVVRKKPNAVLLLPTGNTPKRMYEILAERARKGELDLRKVTIFMLDEYVGGNDYLKFIYDNFSSKLPRDNRLQSVNVLNGRALDLESEAQNYEWMIEAAGGVDLAVLGIGEKGHIGFNEAGSPFDLRSHVVTLAPSTIEANLEAKQKGYKQAVTAGIGTILTARRIILIASGAKKTEILGKMYAAAPTTDIPATALKLHANARVIISEDAAQNILIPTGRGTNFEALQRSADSDRPDVRASEAGTFVLADGEISRSEARQDQISGKASTPSAVSNEKNDGSPSQEHYRIVSETNRSEGRGAVSERREKLLDRQVSFSKSVHDVPGDYDAALSKRVDTRQKLTQGFLFEWHPNSMVKTIPASVERLLTTLVNQRVQWRIDEGVPYDANELRKETMSASLAFVIEEILKNAFDAYAKAGSEGPIRFSILRDLKKDQIILEVSDDGIDFGKITDTPEEFSVYSNSSELVRMGKIPNLEGGKRIGLTWSKMLVGLHGGSLEILKNEYTDFKTTVRMTFPNRALNIQSVTSAADISPKPKVSIKFPLNIHSRFPEGIKAGFGIAGEKRYLVLENLTQGTKEFSVDIPLKLVNEIWGELLPVLMNDGQSEDVRGNFRVTDVGNPQFKRGIKFIAGVNSRYRDQVLNLYAKLAPGQRHIILLSSTEINVSGRRPWNIPGIDVSGSLPDHREFEMEESFFAEPPDVASAPNIQSWIGHTPNGERFIIVRDSSVLGSVSMSVPYVARIHIPLEVVPELASELSNGAFNLEDPYAGSFKTFTVGEGVDQVALRGNILRFPVKIHKGGAVFYRLPSRAIGSTGKQRLVRAEARQDHAAEGKDEVISEGLQKEDAKADKKSTGSGSKTQLGQPSATKRSESRDPLRLQLSMMDLLTELNSQFDRASEFHRVIGRIHLGLSADDYSSAVALQKVEMLQEQGGFSKAANAIVTQMYALIHPLQFPVLKKRRPVILFIAKAGAGKGTVAKKIAKGIPMAHIASGDLLREAVAAQTPQGLVAEEIMKSGALVDMNVMLSLVGERLNQPENLEKGVLFDGLSREDKQIEPLDKMLEKLGLEIDLVVYIEIPDGVVLKRLEEREECPICHATYDPEYQIPLVKGQCDIEGAKLVRRKDDKEKAATEKRLKVFSQNAPAVLEEYGRQGKVVTVSWKYGSDAIAQALIKSYRDGRSEARDGKTYFSKDIPLLMELLSNDNPFIRRDAVEALGRFAVVEAAQKIAGMLGDPSHFVYWEVPVALGWIGAPAVPHVIPFLADEKPLIRGLAADALGKMKAQARDAVPVLMAAVETSDYHDANKFISALGDIGDPAAVSLLWKHAQAGRYVNTSVEARIALEKIQRAAAKPLSALLSEAEARSTQPVGLRSGQGRERSESRALSRDSEAWALNEAGPSRSLGSILPPSVQRIFPDAKKIKANWMVPSFRFHGKTYTHQGRLVPANSKMQTINEEEALALVLDPRGGTRVIITETPDDVTYLAMVAAIGMMEKAVREYSIGLATGGTTEATRKGLGMHAEFIQEIFGQIPDLGKIAGVHTLDDYSWRDPQSMTPEEYRKYQISAYRQEQLYMMLRNLLRHLHEAEIQRMFVSPIAMDASLVKQEGIFRKNMRRFGEERLRPIWKLHGIGTSGHDGFNEPSLKPFVDMTKEIFLDLRKLLKIPNTLERVRQPQSLMREDGAVRVSEITQVQNSFHFVKRQFHPFALRYKGQNRFADLDDTLDVLSRMPFEQIATLYPEEKFRFRSPDHFLDEIQYVLDHYMNTPPYAVTEGIGGIVERSDNSDTRNFFLVFAPHKAAAAKASIDALLNNEATASAMHLMNASVVFISQEAATGLDWNQAFLFRPESPKASLVTAGNIENIWVQSAEGKRIANLHNASSRSEARDEFSDRAKGPVEVADVVGDSAEAVAEVEDAERRQFAAFRETAQKMGPVRFPAMKTRRPVIVLMGKAGSGKGTTSGMFLEATDMVHISTGDLLAEAVQKKTHAGVEAKAYMDKGELVPDAVVIKILEDEFKNSKHNGRGFVFDGFPRNVVQAEALDEFLARLGFSIDFVLHIDISDEEAARRMGTRLMCPLCHATYNNDSMKPKVNGVCDHDGAKLVHRSDDVNPDAVKKRLAMADKNFPAILNYYRDAGKLETVSAELGSETIARALTASYYANRPKQSPAVRAEVREQDMSRSEARVSVADVDRTLAPTKGKPMGFGVFLLAGFSAIALFIGALKIENEIVALGVSVLAVFVWLGGFWALDRPFPKIGSRPEKKESQSHRSEVRRNESDKTEKKSDDEWVGLIAADLRRNVSEDPSLLAGAFQGKQTLAGVEQDHYDVGQQIRETLAREGMEPAQAEAFFSGHSLEIQRAISSRSEARERKKGAPEIETALTRLIKDLKVSSEVKREARRHLGTGLVTGREQSRAQRFLDRQASGIFRSEVRTGREYWQQVIGRALENTQKIIKPITLKVGDDGVGAGLAVASAALVSRGLGRLAWLVREGRITTGEQFEWFLRNSHFPELGDSDGMNTHLQIQFAVEDAQKEVDAILKREGKAIEDIAAMRITADADKAQAAIEEAEAEWGGELFRKKELLEFLRTVFDQGKAFEAGPIFVPRALVQNEARMGLTPVAIRLLRKLGIANDIYVESGVGVNRYTGEVYYSDEDYKEAGATVLSRAAFVEAAENAAEKVVVSIKEPQSKELPLLKNAKLFTYLHLADMKELTLKLLLLVKFAVAYETVSYKEETVNKTPVLAPASHAAGWVSAVRYATLEKADSNFLPKAFPASLEATLNAVFRAAVTEYTGEGSGVSSALKHSLDGKKAVVLGGGVAGEAAAVAMARMGAEVSITEVNPDRIVELLQVSRELADEGAAGSLTVLKRPNPATHPGLSEEIISKLRQANAIIGSILVEGAKAPVEIPYELYLELKEAGQLKFIGDIAIDQGGNIMTNPRWIEKLVELSKAIQRVLPNFLTGSIVHYMGRARKYGDGWVGLSDRLVRFTVTNMPSVVPLQVSQGLERAKLSYLVGLLMGADIAAKAFPELVRGFNILNGKIAHPGVHKAFPELPYQSADEALFRPFAGDVSVNRSEIRRPDQSSLAGEAHRMLKVNVGFLPKSALPEKIRRSEAHTATEVEATNAQDYWNALDARGVRWIMKQGSAPWYERLTQPDRLFPSRFGIARAAFFNDFVVFFREGVFQFFKIVPPRSDVPVMRPDSRLRDVKPTEGDKVLTLIGESTTNHSNASSRVLFPDESFWQFLQKPDGVHFRVVSRTNGKIYEKFFLSGIEKQSTFAPLAFSKVPLPLSQIMASGVNGLFAFECFSFLEKLVRGSWTGGEAARLELAAQAEFGPGAVMPSKSSRSEARTEVDPATAAKIEERWKKIRYMETDPEGVKLKAEAEAKGKGFLDNAQATIRKVAAQIRLDPRILEKLLKFTKVIQVKIPLQLDEGGPTYYIDGYRIGHAPFRGPYKGGIRYAIGVVFNMIQALATEMSVKNAIAGLPYGGGKGGVAIDPKMLSVKELARVTRGYVEQCLKQDPYAFGALLDVPAGDIGTTSREMGWFADEFLRIKRPDLFDTDEFRKILSKSNETGTPYLEYYMRKYYGKRHIDMREGSPIATVTAKPEGKGGAMGRTPATGLGLYYVTREALKVYGERLGIGATVKGQRLAVEAYGNVGSYAARSFFNDGAAILSIKEFVDGRSVAIAALRTTGIDLNALDKHLAEKNADGTSKGHTVLTYVKAFPEDAKEVTIDEFWSSDVTILALAAREKTVNAGIAKLIKAKIISEGANGPLENDGSEQILLEKGAIILPDVATNDGGVAFSSLEWRQNNIGELWPEVAGNGLMEDKVVSAFYDISRVSEARKITLREAAYQIAISKIVDAMLASDPEIGKLFDEVHPPYVMDEGAKRWRPETLPELRQIDTTAKRVSLIAKADSVMSGKVDEIVAEVVHELPAKRGSVILIGGPRASGKPMLAFNILKKLRAQGIKVKLLDMDYQTVEDISRALQGKKIVIRQENGLPGGEFQLEADEILIVSGYYAIGEEVLRIVKAMKGKAFPVMAYSSPDILLDNNWALTAYDLRLMRDILSSIAVGEESTAQEVIRRWGWQRVPETEAVFATWKNARRAINTYLPYELPFLKSLVGPLIKIAIRQETENPGDEGFTLNVLKHLDTLLTGVEGWDVSLLEGYHDSVLWEYVRRYGPNGSATRSEVRQNENNFMWIISTAGLGVSLVGLAVGVGTVLNEMESLAERWRFGGLVGTILVAAAAFVTWILRSNRETSIPSERVVPGKKSQPVRVSIPFADPQSDEAGTTVRSETRGITAEDLKQVVVHYDDHGVMTLALEADMAQKPEPIVARSAEELLQGFLAWQGAGVILTEPAVTFFGPRHEEIIEGGEKITVGADQVLVVFKTPEGELDGAFVRWNSESDLKYILNMFAEVAKRVADHQTLVAESASQAVAQTVPSPIAPRVAAPGSPPSKLHLRKEAAPSEIANIFEKFQGGAASIGELRVISSKPVALAVLTQAILGLSVRRSIFDLSKKTQFVAIGLVKSPEELKDLSRVPWVPTGGNMERAADLMQKMALALFGKNPSVRVDVAVSDFKGLRSNQKHSGNILFVFPHRSETRGSFVRDASHDFEARAILIDRAHREFDRIRSDIGSLRADISTKLAGDAVGALATARKFHEKLLDGSALRSDATELIEILKNLNRLEGKSEAFEGVAILKDRAHRKFDEMELKLEASLSLVQRNINGDVAVALVAAHDLPVTKRDAASFIAIMTHLQKYGRSETRGFVLGLVRTLLSNPNVVTSMEFNVPQKDNDSGRTNTERSYRIRLEEPDQTDLNRFGLSLTRDYLYGLEAVGPSFAVAYAGDGTITSWRPSGYWELLVHSDRYPGVAEALTSILDLAVKQKMTLNNAAVEYVHVLKERPLAKRLLRNKLGLVAAGAAFVVGLGILGSAFGPMFWIGVAFSGAAFFSGVFQAYIVHQLRFLLEVYHRERDSALEMPVASWDDEFPLFLVPSYAVGERTDAMRKMARRVLEMGAKDVTFRRVASDLLNALSVENDSEAFRGQARLVVKDFLFKTLGTSEGRKKIVGLSVMSDFEDLKALVQILREMEQYSLLSEMAEHHWEFYWHHKRMETFNFERNLLVSAANPLDKSSFHSSGPSIAGHLPMPGNPHRPEGGNNGYSTGGRSEVREGVDAKTLPTEKPEATKMQAFSNPLDDYENFGPNAMLKDLQRGIEVDRMLEVIQAQAELNGVSRVPLAVDLPPARAEIRATEYAVAGDVAVIRDLYQEDPWFVASVTQNLRFGVLALRIMDALKKAGALGMRVIERVSGVSLVNAAETESARQNAVALVSKPEILNPAKVKAARAVFGETLTKASDVFILGSEFAFDRGAIAVMRIIFGDAPVAVLVRDQKDRDFVKRFNQELVRANRPEILMADNVEKAQSLMREESAQLRAHGVTSVKVKALVAASEPMAVALKERIPDTMFVTDAMLGNFLNQAGLGISRLVADIQAQFAIRKSA